MVAPRSAPGGGTAPAALTLPLSVQGSDCCSPSTFSAAVTQGPSWPNLCFKVKYVWKTSQSFENISITFLHSSPCSDSSWASFSAFPMWTQTIPPQLIFRLVVVNNFFVSGILLWRVFIPFLLVFFLNFFPPSTSKTQAEEALYLCCGCELVCICLLYSHISPSARMSCSRTLTSATVSFRHTTNYFF